MNEPRTAEKRLALELFRIGVAAKNAQDCMQDEDYNLAWAYIDVVVISAESAERMLEEIT